MRPTFNFTARQFNPSTKNLMPYQITLPNHPDQLPNRDPRKVWIYDCSFQGKWKVDAPRWRTERTYMFEREDEFLMFKLRWESAA